MRLLPGIASISLLAFGAGSFSTPTRADEKGDALLRQVKATVHALNPLVGEYTVTLHGKAGDKVNTCKEISSAFGGSGWSSSGNLQQSIFEPDVFDLFDPLKQVPTATRYVGRQDVNGQSYEVVEMKLPLCTLQIFLGSDNLIHRVKTTLGTPPTGFVNPVNPNTGQHLTPEQLMAARVKPATAADSNLLELVVTDYHKLRAFPPRPALPTPARSLSVKKERRLPVSMALSPHGEQIAVLCSDNTILVMNTVMGAQMPAPENIPPNLRSLTFSPDGARLAGAGGQSPIPVWEVATGKQVFTLADTREMIAALSFSPDGTKIAGVSVGDKVFLWDAATGRELPALLAPHTRAIAFAPDGKMLAALSDKPETQSATVTLWDMAAGKPLHTIELKLDWGLSLAYSPNGRWLAVNQLGNGLHILDGATGEKLRVLPNTGGRVSAMRFSADSKSLIVLDQDERGDWPTHQPGITLWNTATWQIAHAYGVADASPFLTPDQVRISADGYTFAIMGVFDKEPKFWTVPNE